MPSRWQVRNGILTTHEKSNQHYACHSAVVGETPTTEPKIEFVVNLSDTVVGVFTDNYGEGMYELPLHAIPMASSQLNSDDA